MIPLLCVLGDDVLRVFDERTGGVHHFHSARLHFLLELGRNAVRADDEHAGFVGGVLRAVNRSDLFGGQHIGYLLVVNQRPDGVNRFFACGLQLKHFVNGAFYAGTKARAFGDGDVLFFFHTYIIGN